ncbi:pentapeptide repeat-containing protein [Amycolatopsis sp. cg5]|uniref:pentapeptide repeat-containing protein n=1 Tax=Amycolatopsis sp. cg5 TaxID=3238802 RepID=UPI0035256A77
MTSDETWPQCRVRGCAGAALATECLLHINSADRADYLRWVNPIDGRGVRFTAELIHEVYTNLPKKGRPARTVLFTGAVFPDDASFGGARFGDGSSFAGANFGDDAFFRGARFGKDIKFDGAKFGRHPSFRGARFEENSSFKGTDFGDNPWFRGSVFGKRASFVDAKFGDHAYFRYTRFGDGTRFQRATFGKSATFVDTVRFEGTVYFTSVTFGDELGFGKVLITGQADFTKASFGAEAKFNVFSREPLSMAYARFGRHAQINFAGRELSLHGADFSEGGSIRAWGTEIDLTRAKFGAPSLLTERKPVTGPRTAPPVEPGQRPRLLLDLDPDPEGFVVPNGTPRLMSLDEADVRELVIDRVDLGSCRFNQAHNLDQLKVGSSDQFLLPDRKFGPTRRRIVLEEYLWRARHERRSRWSLPDPPAIEDTPGDPRAQARQIEQTYRALRKAFEDVKNEPGSADFYYGEMEMRRRGSESRAERFLLYCYWLLAGYGLRAWRALTALAVTVAVGTVIFVSAGFATAATTSFVPTSGGTYVQTTVPGPRPGWSDALSYSLHSITSLIRPAGTIPLTAAGNYTELTLRILGPLLLGLALLSIRARVKR